IVARPRAFFVDALAVAPDRTIWFGAETSPDDTGLYMAVDLAHPKKMGAGLGSVASLAIDARGDIWVGTTSRGVYRFHGLRLVDHYTFENTARGLRSNLVYRTFVDRQGVLWFGTEHGVSRFDPHGLSAQTVSEDPDG